MSGSICNPLQIKSLQLSAVHRNEHLGRLLKHALKVNRRIETKLSNSQRLPNLSLPPSDNSLASSPAFTTCPPQISGSNTFSFTVLSAKKRNIAGEFVVSGSFLFYSISTQWLDLKKHFQQAIPAPQVAMETPHLKIEHEE